jgi:hypothetical protein
MRIGISSNQMFYYFFLENFNMLSKILKIMTPMLLMRKEKHCELVLM